jgi:Putative GTPase activating protein for Arf
MPFHAIDVDPDWVAFNLGLLVCHNCSGVHRSLGTHISKIRSLTLDKWEPQLLQVQKYLGNTIGNSILESGLSERVLRPEPVSMSLLYLCCICGTLELSTRFYFLLSLSFFLSSFERSLSLSLSLRTPKLFKVELLQFHVVLDWPLHCLRVCVCVCVCVFYVCLWKDATREERDAFIAAKYRDKRFVKRDPSENVNKLSERLYECAVSNETSKEIIPQMLELIVRGANINWVNFDENCSTTLHFLAATDNLVGVVGVGCPFIRSPRRSSTGVRKQTYDVLTFSHPLTFFFFFFFYCILLLVLYIVFSLFLSLCFLSFSLALSCTCETLP